MSAPKEAEFARYSSLKVDTQVIQLVKAAAALSGESVRLQDFLSDLLNDVCSKQLGRKPIKRRPSPPRTKDA